MFLFIVPSSYTLAYQPLMYHLFPFPNNPCSHQPNSIPVGVLPSMISVLGVCEVGCIPITSAIILIYSLLSIAFVCPPILPVSTSVSIPSTTLTVLLLSLSFISVISYLTTSIYLYSEVHILASWLVVINKVDVIYSHLPKRVPCKREQSHNQFPFEWNLMLISLLSAPFGHVIMYLFSWQKNLRNLSITLRHGSTSGFLSSSLFLCCSNPSPSNPHLAQTTAALWFSSPNALLLRHIQPDGGWWWSINPFLHVPEAFQNMSVPLSPCLAMAWWWKNAGTPGISCGFWPLCMHQRDGVLLRPCHIEARSN